MFSQLFLRNEKNTIDGIPVSVTFQAIAEKPKIVVRLNQWFGCQKKMQSLLSLVWSINLKIYS